MIGVLVIDEKQVAQLLIVAATRPKLRSTMPTSELARPAGIVVEGGFQGA